MPSILVRWGGHLTVLALGGRTDVRRDFPEHLVRKTTFEPHHLGIGDAGVEDVINLTIGFTVLPFAIEEVRASSSAARRGCRVAVSRACCFINCFPEGNRCGVTGERIFLVGGRFRSCG